MKARQLWFTEPYRVEVREQELSPPKASQLLVRSLYSGISAGTELLVYRGQIPESLALDESIDALADSQAIYPLQYGYACVGEVIAAGAELDPSWVGRRVFSFQPHASHFLAAPSAVIPLPDDLDPKSAVFLANMETAVNLLQDGRPVLGERAVVIGQGIVGLLLSLLLARFPLTAFHALDSIASRREMAAEIGAELVCAPDDEEALSELKARLDADRACGADVVFELSGSPAALDLATSLCAYSGRIVVGSWYGTKTANINLGERFHRNRMQIISSQVSSIAPELEGRWDKPRRFSVALDMIRRCEPEQMISHQLSLDAAAEAYRLLDAQSAEVRQVIFDYTS